jgi:small subunit ribosomal protein S6
VNQYEGMLIINTALDNASLRKTVADVQDIITREGGQIVSVEEWGRRKLAYEVKKHADGYYLLVNFDLAGDKVARVRSLFLLNESILRFLIVIRVPRQAVSDRPQEEAGAHAAASY